MSKTFDQGREEIAKLCRYFADNRQAFLAPGVKEAHVRLSLIDPFFEALGWDLRNAAMVAPQYREVITEDSLEIEGQQKAPDYAFRVGTLAKFYTEAKKCGININADPGPAYQLRRYGWSAKVPLSILTDFEEFGVYDCSLRPRSVDKASFGRIQYFRSEEYPDCWRNLWDIFSREAVWAGAYDRYAASKRKRGTSEVDSEFLKEIESWRDSLARNIALRNLYLGYDDLNTAVQRTIDRLIFLRMAEDRGSESYGQLLKLCEQPEIYVQFMKLCRKADEKYNSGIFHFQKEDGVSELHDRLTPALTIDDKIIKPILQNLYFEHGSPYHFGVLPVEILGTVYERFLGKVIRLTHEHRAKVEEKPEVRKAGGVYYTPAYIVDYIVKNTVGKMIEGKSPAQLAGGKNGQPLRVLDMACGSGSFLLGAYQCLLDHYLKWYLDNRPEKYKEAVYLDSRGKYWRLTIAEKKRILTTHIFGVDIDLQAVEVSKLSLLLKVLEGETDETVGQSRQLFHERALPNLSNNIKCGNSLIGPDYFSGRLIPDPDEIKRVNPFDWNREFPDAMKSGGFDCVIGNPPYGAFLGETEKDYLRNKYTCQSYQLDSYLLFLERAIRDLLNHFAHFGMIIPNPWLTNLLQTNTRRFVTKNTRICEIVHFSFPVFPKVTVDTEIVILQKASPKEWQAKVTIIKSLDSFHRQTCSENQQISHNQEKWTDLDGGVINIFTNQIEESLAKKCSKIGEPFDSLCIINVGIKPYQIGKGKPPQTKEIVKTRPFDNNRRVNASYRPYLRGRDINRYEIAPLEPRFLKYGPWLAESRPSANFDSPLKIVMRQTGDSLIATIDTEKYLCLNNMHVIVPQRKDISPFFILGIINSRLLNWYYHMLNPEIGEALAEVKKTNVTKLPIRLINFSNKAEKSAYDRIVDLVNSILTLNKKHSTENSQTHKDILQRQIDAIDCEIDQIVYELYGLTEKEIKIVENTRS